MSQNGGGGNVFQQRWLWGVLCSITASAFSALGTILQKYSHLQNSKLPAEQQLQVSHGFLLKSRLWVIGLILLVVFPLPFNVAALSLADQSLITPLFGLTLVLKIFAPIFLKETLTCVDLISSVTILVGSTITVLAANHEPDTRSLEELQGLYHRFSFLVAEGGLLLSVLLSLIVLQWDTRRSFAESASSSAAAGGNSSRSVEGEDLLEYGWASCSRACQRFGQFYQNLQSRFLPSGGVKSALSSLFYAFIAGAFGAQANIGIKLVGTLMFGSYIHSRGILTAFQWPGFYVSLVLVACFATMQLSYLNEGLARYDAVTYVPEYYACLMTLGTIYGGIFFEEFQGQYYPPAKTMVFTLGCTTVLVGVLMRLLKAHFGGSNEDREDWRQTCQKFYYQRFDQVADSVFESNRVPRPHSMRTNGDSKGSLSVPSGCALDTISYEQFMNDSIFCCPQALPQRSVVEPASGTTGTSEAKLSAPQPLHSGYTPPKYTPAANGSSTTASAINTSADSVTATASGSSTLV